MLPLHLYTISLILGAVSAQITLTGTNVATSSFPTGGEAVTTTGLVPTLSSNSSIIIAASSSGSSSSRSSASSSSSLATVTFLVGATSTSTLNGTALRNATSSTTSSILPINTQPCNGYPEFCTRRYSNVTYVAAHNSPFDRAGSAASNQQLDVLTQLQDGIRMLQFETHRVNDTMYLCHTSCDILNAGTLEDYLSTVKGWLADNPYEVITILMGNSDVVTPQNYTAPVINSGIIDYVYTAPKAPMGLDDWPPLQELILTNKRAIIMLDYEANTTAIPWLLDEFALMFETPFSPTNLSFPCTAQRPPTNWPFALPRQDRMYMANHNLNVDISLAGINLLVPGYSSLNITNSAEVEYGSLAATRINCTAMWNRPPTFLLVDYYNIGNYNGSVFQVAADANNVTYNRDSCCGTPVSFGIRLGGGPEAFWASIAFACLSLFLLS